MQSLNNVRDEDLLRQLSRLVEHSRGAEADVIAHIGEVEARRAYAREAVSSMFAYCTEILHFSEPEAILRLRAARASRKHPALLPMLREGRLHLSGIALLAPYLTEQNRDALLRRATHKSKRRIEEIVAEMQPRPDAPASIRKLPKRSEAPAQAAALLCPDTVATPGLASRQTRSPQTKAATIEALAPNRYLVRFTANAELREKLDRLQALMRASVPYGDLAQLIDIAVTEKLERVEAKRFAKTKAPRKALAETDTTPSSRHIPAAVRRLVHNRDGGRCAYRDKRGRRCAKRHDLEFHHKEPFARGGDHSPSNLTLMCRAHNTLLAEQDYGKDVMARFRASASRATVPVDVYGAPIAVQARSRAPG